MTRTAETCRAWLVLLVPPSAWALYEFGLGIAVGAHCRAAVTPLGVAWGGLSLLVCLGAGVLARALLRRPAHRQAATCVWLVRLAPLGAALFGLAILFQTIATLLIPPCLR